MTAGAVRLPGGPKNCTFSIHMTDEIRVLLAAKPFVPFTIQVADGREFHIPTQDHAHIRPGGQRIGVFTDDGRENVLSALLLTGVAFNESHPEPSV